MEPNSNPENSAITNDAATANNVLNATSAESYSHSPDADPNGKKIADAYYTPPSLKAALSQYGVRGLLSLARQLVWARLQLRTCNSIGRWVRVKGRVHVHNEGTILIQDRVRFLAEAAMIELVTWNGGRIEIGEATA